MKILQVGLIIFFTLPITACGTQTTEEILAPEDAYPNQVVTHNEMFARLDAKSNTAWAAVPISGGAQFLGSALVVVNPGVGETNILGKSEVNVDFSSGDVDGSLSDFVGLNASDEYSAYTGVIDLSGGFVGLIDPNDIYADYEGTLVGHENVVALDGFVYGRLIGTPIVGIELSDDSDLIVDGVATPGLVFIIGEK